MKKLVLLVSVFLLLTGLVFADVTFAPAVTGDASVTWGLDLQPNGHDYKKVNSGFTAANNATFDLGVTIDPFDAMTGEEGMYGEIELTGMAVTAKSGSDVAVTAPTVTAKLYFMESLYMRVCTNPEPAYDLVTPLGALVSVDGEDQEGTWDESIVDVEYGNAGYGFTYMMDALTVNADFVSNDEWGNSGDTTSFALEDYDVDEDGWLTGAEVIALDAAVITYYDGTEASSDDTYAVLYVGSAAGGYQQVMTNDDGDIALLEIDTDDDNAVVYAIDNTTDSINTSLYTLGMDVTYDLDGIGSFMAYVLPTHENQWNTFSAWGYGGKVTIDAVDMVTPVFAVDAKYDETNGFKGSDKREILEWEAYVEVPVSYEVSEDISVDASVKMAAADSALWSLENDKYLQERVVYDVYASAGADAMGASIDAAYMMSEAFYQNGQSSSLTIDASYELEALGGTITPSAGWAVDYGTMTKGDEDGFLTVAVAAAVVDNTTFTLKYASGDLLEIQNDNSDAHDPGVVTFETKIAY